MTKIYSLEDGFTEAAQAIDTIFIAQYNPHHKLFTTKEPIFVAVYGDPVSGAASFVKEIQQFFAPTLQEMRDKACTPRVLSVWQPFQQQFFEHFNNYKHHFWPAAFLLHCPWERNLKNQYRDPDHLVRDYADDTIDLRIGIYNPLFSSGTRGEYDLVIANQHLPDDKISLKLPSLSKAL
ncbi:MAG: hypothetical protein Q8R37_04155 [Nanoarchaeota archaeon]|nr:hypothetical protein [Nanoarchaeota archaeon]